jgi:hypothetical protein
MKNFMKHIEIKNSKIIIGIGSDAIYLSYNIFQNKKLIYQTDICSFYFIKDKNCYLLLINIRVDVVEFKKHISPILNKYTHTNKIHILLTAECHGIGTVYNFIDKNYNNSLKYTICMIAGEIYSDQFVDNVNDDLFKGILTSTYNTNIIDNLADKSKYDLNYLYTLIYFYYLGGYYLGVVDDNVISNNHRFPKIFYYSKLNNPKKQFIELIEKNIPNELLYPKHYTNDIRDLTKFSKTPHLSHFTTSFFDYTTCMFNLTFESSIYNGYMTEKTLKAIISNTPTFLVINDDVYHSLKEYGFYFLNDEFDGNSIMERYLNFIDYFKKCNETEIKKLYERTSILSLNNRKLLYQYIHSYKDKELEYLLEI